MSEEREFLKRFADSKWNYDDWCLLKADAEELLAQPTQTPDYYLWHDEVHEEHPTTDGDPEVYPLYLKPLPLETLVNSSIYHNAKDKDK